MANSRLVFTGGPIYTMDRRVPKARAVYVDNGRIVDVVAVDQALETPVDASWEVVDLHGRTLLPAFTDCHVHMLYTGWHSYDASLETATTVSELLELVQAAIETSSGDLVRAWNYDDSRFERALVGRDLDSVARDRPVVLGRIGNSACCLNTAAMRLLEIPLQLPGVHRDNDGSPTGVFFSEANHLIMARIYDALDQRERLQIFGAAANAALSSGVTNVHAIEGDMYRQLSGDPPVVNQPIADLTRFDLAVEITVFDNQVRSLADLERVASQGGRHVGGDIFVDGVLGAAYMPGVYRAALSEPYADGQAGGGHLLIERAQLAQLARAAADNGLQISVHAVGDRAIATFLDALDDVAGLGIDVSALRPRIEHGILPTGQDIDRAARLGVVFSMQPAFELHAGGPGRRYEQRLGSERVRHTHPLRQLVSAGVCVAGGSDSPVNPISPLQGIQAALQHPFAESRLDPDDAIAMFTRNAALAAFAEKERGSICEGRVADFVVLSEDLYAISPETIGDVQVLETWRLGTRAYSVADTTDAGAVWTGDDAR